MAKLVDAADLKFAGVIHIGSSPIMGTKPKEKLKMNKSIEGLYFPLLIYMDTDHAKINDSTLGTIEQKKQKLIALFSHHGHELEFIP